MKLITILSNDDDGSTNKVMSFIGWNGGQMERLGQNKKIKELTLTFESNHAYLNRSVFWYRRFDFHLALSFKISTKHPEVIKNYLVEEWKVVKSFLHRKKKFITLGSYEKEFENNVLCNLECAKYRAGLYVPNMILTTEKKDLLSFQQKHKKMISKPLRSYPLVESENRIWYSNGAFILQKEQIDKLSESFYPILALEYIEKEYEIRIFYLKGKCYSMAIFSQLDEKTKTDFRNYNQDKPTRNVPYKLPQEIEEKICLFMEISGLDTGSIDMIKSINGQYYFLEVNPSGQFDWLSANCNYYIEKKIAHYLTHGNTKFY